MPQKTDAVIAELMDRRLLNDVDPDLHQEIAKAVVKAVHTASLQGEDAVERVAQTIREYCIGVSPASIQLSHGVERIYYAGLPVLELARAILATGLVSDEAAIRAAAFEEAAKIAEQQAVEFLSPEYACNQPFSSICERFACEEVAAAIRAAGENAK